MPTVPNDVSADGDPLTEVLRLLRVRATVYFVQQFSAPWGMRIPARPHAQFHTVLQGSCKVAYGDRTYTVVERDVVLFPNGDAHVVFDGQTPEVLDGRTVVQSVAAGRAPFQQGPPTVQLLSGHFEFDREAGHLLTSALGSMIHVPLAREVDVSLLASLYPLLQAEVAADLPGADSIAGRLCEIFLVQVLRSHSTRAQAAPGLLRAMFDSRLGRALSLMHARWKEPLTVHDLARAAGMSRSAFCERFAREARTTPMAYLARWRVLQGRSLLLRTGMSVAEIAEASGHGSPESFSRSFRQMYGMSPAQMRSVQMRSAQMRPA